MSVVMASRRVRRGARGSGRSQIVGRALLNGQDGIITLQPHVNSHWLHDRSVWFPLADLDGWIEALTALRAIWQRHEEVT